MKKMLTTKQQLFCDEYINNGFDAKNAALAAGYSAAYANSRSHELPDHPLIQECLHAAHSKSMERLGLSFDWKIKTLERIVNENMKCMDKPQHAKAAIAAISELNRMSGDLAPRKQLTVKVDATFEKLTEARRVYKEF